jgi:hypothetical protein
MKHKPSWVMVLTIAWVSIGWELGGQSVNAEINAVASPPIQGPQIPIPQTATQVPGPVFGPMTKAYVQTVGRMAYLWGWPLVNVHNQRTALTKVPEPSLLNGVLPVGPVNQLTMLTGYVDPAMTYIACPNQDVVYGLGYLSFEKEPIVIQVPDFGDRFWTLPVYDARTDQINKLGLQHGTKPGFYIIAGPNWKGDVPQGIAGMVSSSTNYGVAMPRIFMNETPEDRQAIQPLLNQILFYPLSEFDGKMKTKDWSKLPTIKAPEEKSHPWVNPETFFDELPIVMKEVPPMPGEEALYQLFGSLLDAAAKDPEVKKTLQETAITVQQELIPPLIQWHYNGQPAGNGWTTPVNNGAFGTDYYHRTGAVFADPYDNIREETAYFYTDTDSELTQLDGDSSYTVTFAKGQVPPVKGFWSMTLYNEDHFFHSNALKRFSLGTKNKSLRYAPDGSLTIYVGANSPGKENESNWLPAPNGKFSLWIRAYWAEPTVLDGTWKPPAVSKTP